MDQQRQLLSFGSQGEDVKELHEALKILDYVIPISEIQGNIFGDATREAVNQIQELNNLEASGELDARTAHVIWQQYESMRPRILRGRIYRIDGRPLSSDISVRLIQVHLQGESPIEDKDSFDNGAYEFIYKLCQLDETDSTHLALRVAVFDKAGTELASSSIQYHPSINEVLDIQVPDKVPHESEYKQLFSRLQPFLDKTKLTDLDQKHVSYLINLTGIERTKVESLVESHKLARSLDIPEEFAFVLHNEGIAISPQELLEKPQTETLAAIEWALKQSQLNNSEANKLKRFVRGNLADKQIESQLHIPKADETPTWGSYINTIPDKFCLSAETPRRFARLLIEKGAGAEDLWNRAKNAKLPEQDIKTLKVVTALRDLTGGHLPMMEALHKKRLDDHRDSIEFLTRMKPVDWLNIAYTVGTPPNTQLTAGDYARQLEAKIEAHFPTDVFAKRLGQGLIKLNDFPTSKVIRFLSKYSDFKLTATHVEPYLFDQHVKDEDNKLKKALMGIQRARLLSANWEEASILYNKGFDSASKIIRYGRHNFHKEIGDSIDGLRLNDIYARAQETYLATLHLMFDYSPRFMPGDMVPLRTKPLSPKRRIPKNTVPDVLEKYATLRSLFGDLDYCECRHCQSVLSPAAYFVDLLQFLKIPNEKVKGTVLDVLLERRPDLVDLDLSCENTNTEIPYIDLVTELLENAVALPFDIQIPARADVETDLTKALKTGDIPTFVLDALKRTAIKIDNSLILEKIENKELLSGDSVEWVIHDTSRRWSLRYWKRQLNHYIFPDTPLAVVTIQDLHKAVQSLDSGALDKQLLTYLAPEPNLPIYGTPMVTKRSVNSWRVKYVRGVAISFIPINNQRGKVEVLTLGGTNILTRDVSVSYLQELLQDLVHRRSDRINDALRLLGLPKLAYQVTENTRRKWWELRYSGDEIFELQEEHLSVAALTYQNSSIQEDLLAYPENRNPKAYTKLKDKDTVYPWSLPFNLWLEESRAFLEKLGISREKLMELCNPEMYWKDPDIAIELLGLSKQGAELIAPVQSHKDLWQFWGLNEKRNEIEDHFSGDTRTGNWLTLVKRVSILLQQSGLSLRELYDLLATQYIRAINPKLAIKPDNECRPSKLTLNSIKEKDLEKVLDRIHRFVRLWRKLGWSMPEVDRAINTFGSGTPIDLTSATLMTISLIQRLCNSLNLPVRVVLCWFVGLDTQTITEHTQEGTPELPSLYAATFLRHALHMPEDLDFKLDDKKSELAYLSQPRVMVKKLSEKASLIGAAVGIRPSDLSLLVDPSNSTGIPDELRIENLSKVYRIATLTQALGISIDEYLRLVAVTGINPFLDPPGSPFQDRIIAVLKFIEAVEFVRASAFSLDELEYLLLHKIKEGGPFSQTEKEQEDFLKTLHLALRQSQVLAEVTLENVKRQLARLEWPEQLIDLITSQDGIGYYAEVNMDILISHPGLNLPLNIPADLSKIFTYDSTATKIRLWCRGVASNQDFANLANAIPAIANEVGQLKATYEKELQDHAALLYKRMQSLTLPKEQFRESTNPPFTVSTASANEFDFDKDFAWRLSFDGETNELVWIGWMTLKERNALKKMLPSMEHPIDKLYGKVRTYKPQADDVFIRDSDAKTLLGMPVLEDRIYELLLRLLLNLEKTNLITQLSSFLKVDVKITEILAAYLKDTNAVKTALQLLTDAKFIESADEDITSTTKDLADQFDVVQRLKKSALLIQKMALALEETQWLTNGKLTILDVAKLPTTETTTCEFDGWKELLQLIHLRDSIFGTEETIERLLAKLDGKNDSAKSDEFHSILAEVFKLSTSEAKAAASVLQMTWEDSYREPARLLELANLLYALKQMGTTVAKVKLLIQPEPDEENAKTARRLLQAQFNAETLAQRLKPATDQLREKQRDALVVYLVAKKGLRDVEALYDDMLIDIKMSSCMMTSRIKQAISSVQLFVQKCLMNLEDQVQLSETAAEEMSTRWRYIDRYRVWEANRRVFLTPENWIEPELRDDKSEIFRSLESDLSKDELDHEQAVEAFRKYLERLQEIAHLTILNIYSENPDNGSNNMLKKTVHLIGRDGEKPYRYFYRQWRISSSGISSWTPWEEISLQINSDHVLIFRRRGAVYLAWPNISRTSKGTWQVSLNLGKRTSSGWTSLKTSRGCLEHPVRDGKDERTTFAFRLNPSNTKFEIDCYAADDGNEATTKFVPDSEGPIIANQHDHDTVTVTASGWVLGHWTENGEDHYAPVAGSQVALEFMSAVAIQSSTDITGSNGHYFRSINLGKAKSLHASVGYLKLIGFDSSLYTAANPLIRITLSKNGDYYQDRWINHTFVLQFKNPPTLPAKPPEREVDLKKLGHFTIQLDDEIQTKEKAGRRIEKVIDTEHFSSVYREIATPREQDILTIGFDTSSVSCPQLLSATPGQFMFTPSTGNQSQEELRIWAYKDDRVQFLIQETKQNKYHLLADGHDYADDLQEKLYLQEVENALALGRTIKDEPVSQINNSCLDMNYTSSTKRGIDYDLVLPYAGYNWEIFFHIPFFVATQLSKNFRFAEAERWFHLIFDPTSSESGDTIERFWRFLPFQLEGKGKPIDDLLALLAKKAADKSLNTTELRLREEILQQIEEFKAHPFQPHAIARHRKRAYMFSVVLKYLDNLIAWGDQYFSQGGIEAINKATLLYICAHRILGQRPQSAPKCSESAPLTYRLLEGKLDEFSNAWISFEGLAESINSPSNGARGLGLGDLTKTEEINKKIQEFEEQIRSVGTLYFCVPNNEKLLEYFNIVEDRLFKIRHCMNIDGVPVQWPLFDPPIDPKLLIQAAATGLDIADVLNDLYAPLPHFRFSFLLPKALELVAEVKSMGAALLSALEKKDAEELALLRSKQEIELLEKVKMVREQQVQDSQANLNSLRHNRETASKRYAHYQKLLGKPDPLYPPEQTSIPLEDTTLSLAPSGSLAGDEKGLGLLLTEQEQLGWLGTSAVYTWIKGSASTLSGLFHAVPNISVEADTGLVKVATEHGGDRLGNVASAAASFAEALASNASYVASRVSIISGYQRRRDEWALQNNLAAREIEQIDKQILAAQIRNEIAKHELDNHETQISNAKKMDEFMQLKYTNRQLYQWMTGQLSGVYFQVYKLAYDLAKRAERAYRSELGLSNSNFIRTGYFDKLKKGLLAGEQLYLDVKRMEMAYLEREREHEITKHISLLQLDPQALIELREKGMCEVSLPEALFDLDVPGGYMRRIKSVSLSIPSVTGPYTSVNCMLTLLKSSVRVSDTLRNGKYVRDAQNEDSRFIDDFATNQSIVTSNSQNDSGLFELNLREERFLPFEGAGVISKWRLELPTDFRQFDYGTISDVVIHLRYTARSGSELFRTRVSSELVSTLNAINHSNQQTGFSQLFSLRHNFPTEWYRLLNTADATGDHSQSFNLSKENFPYLFQRRKLQIRQVDLFSIPKDAQKITAYPEITLPNKQQLHFDKNDPIGQLSHWTCSTTIATVAGAPNPPLDFTVPINDANWKVHVGSANVKTVLEPAEDILILCTYTVQ